VYQLTDGNAGLEGTLKNQLEGTTQAFASVSTCKDGPGGLGLIPCRDAHFLPAGTHVASALLREVPRSVLGRKIAVPTRLSRFIIHNHFSIRY